MSVESLSKKVAQRKGSFSSIDGKLSRTHQRQRSMSVSDDSLTDISTELPDFNPVPKAESRPRRFSEIKTNHERRTSIPQSSIMSLLPNWLRSSKNGPKTTTTRDEATLSVPPTHWHNDRVKLETLSTVKSPSESITESQQMSSSGSSNDESRPSFIVDERLNEPQSAEHCSLLLRIPLCLGQIYRDAFHDHFHMNYAGESESEGPFLVSLIVYSIKNSTIDEHTSTSSRHEVRALIRVPIDNFDVSATISSSHEDSILPILFKKSGLPSIVSCKPIAHPKANEKIYEFDKSNDERNHCKIGFIYQGRDQKDENELFANDKITEDMIDFLQLLADRVRLKGFTKYRGDLDVKDDLHGEYSYHTSFENHEIMFNVAPMILPSKTNGPRIERKGLVSNAFVCIVFQEPGSEFNPEMISGKVTQVYITVQPRWIDTTLYYKIQVWHRTDLPTEIEPNGGLWKCDRFFRDYFLTLILNSVDAAINSNILRTRVREQRERMKNDQLKKLIQTLINPPLQEYNGPIEYRHGSRAESFAHTSRNSNVDRMSPVHNKKGRLSKLFGVFSNKLPNEPAVGTSNSPPSPDHTTANVSINLDKETMRRKSSVKNVPAPGPPAIPPRPNAIVKPSASSSAMNQMFSAPSPSESIPPTQLVTTFTRNRSNSSPIDVSIVNKPPHVMISPITEERSFPNADVNHNGSPVKFFQ